MEIDISALLQQVVRIARGAGERILSVYQKDFDVELKHDRSPLTEADLASHRHIVSTLEALTPEISILSEESDEVGFEVRKEWQQYWLIDPLDGTREFIKRNGEFTVNIALIDRHQPVLGVVYAPVSGEMFYAVKGGFAWFQNGNHDPVRIRCRKTQGDLVIIGSRSHVSEKMKAFLETLEGYRLISLGSSLKFCYIAMGKADLYVRLGPTSEWDTAAAQCIVEAAGGKVTRTDFSTLEYNTKPSLLNPDFLAYCELSDRVATYFREQN